MKKSKNFRTKQKTNKWIDDVKHNSKASILKEGEVHAGISAMSVRQLPKSSYGIKADPYTAANETSTPYNFLAPFNSIVGGSYVGDDNIDGGNVQQYSNSVTSSFTRAIDNALMHLEINYRYLPIHGGEKVGTGLVDEMRKSISEALSVLQSTTYTALNINSFAVETDMNLGTAEPTTTITETINGVDTKIPVYTNKTDVLYAMSIYYQIFLQECLSVMTAHNSFRLKQGEIIRDGWNREVPYLNSFFGLMNKKSFLSLLDGINLSFEGEYVDTDFAQQANMIHIMPSRRSESMFDPLKEIKISFAHPTIFKLLLKNNDGTISNVVLYSDSELPKCRITTGWNEDTDIYENDEFSFWDTCLFAKDIMTAYDTKVWARSLYSDRAELPEDNLRFNNIKACFDAINRAFIIFKPKWADFRDCFDIMTRTGSITWTKGFRPAVVQDTNSKVVQNKIVDDIYQMVMAGNSKLTFNANTKRWENYSLWNMYSGIPSYDVKLGGSFITFSSKDIQTSDDKYNETVPYLPVMFTPNASAGAYLRLVDRNGRVYYVDYAVTNMYNNVVLNRLTPLRSQKGLEIKIPTVKLATTTDDARSYIERCLLSMFGLCNINVGEADRITLDSDIVAVYQIEITDVTNAAITYARTYAPFRGTTADSSILGFLGTSKSK